jgi:NADH dehydrogenase
MRILITGAHGFIGRNLGRYLTTKGHWCAGTARSVAALTSNCPWLKEALQFELEDAHLGFDLSQLKIECVIHCAHDFTSGHKRVNVSGTRLFAEQARLKGVTKQIFVSSYSGRPDAVTEYGQTKYEIESFFLENGFTVVRPGLVLGDGGIFGRILKMVRTFPVIPLIGGGCGAVPLVGIVELAESLELIAKDPTLDGTYNLFQTFKPSLAQLVDEIVKVLGVRRLKIAIPLAFVDLPLSICKRLGIKLPIDIDNVRAFALNQAAGRESDLDRLLMKKNSLSIVLQESL